MTTPNTQKAPVDLTALSREVAQPLHLNDPQVAAQMVCDGLGYELRIRNDVEAYTVLNTLLQGLLDAGLYADAARLLWKPTQFSPDPRCVGMIFDTMREESQILIQGAASMGKSFNLGVWHYLDWRRDPQFTNIQIVGPSEKHLENNLFSHLIALHNSAAIPGPGIVTQLCISLDPHDKYAGIKGVVIPLGKKSAGRLQGVKVKPRPKPHPTLGKMTRLRVILEEAENIPPGVWEDVINISANVGETAEQFKVSAAYNPKDITSQVGIRAEPVDGWQSIDLEASEKWRSKRGWAVLRLDAYKTENVREGTERFAGLQTKRGLERVIQQAGGVGTPGYYCADHTTEVMSRTGWKRYDALRVGDQIYTLNPKTGLAEWQAVEEVFAKEFDGELVSMEGRGFSALVTANHRWAVCSDPGHPLRFKETSELLAYDHIPLCRGAAGYGARHAPELAELVGLVQADGNIPESGNGQRVTLYQSHRANAGKCARIEELFGALRARCSRTDRPDGMSAFRFSGALAREVRAALGGSRKTLAYGFIESLDRESLAALWNGLRLGDGGVVGGSTEYVCTSRPEEADIYAFISARLGYATTTERREHVGAGRTFPNGLLSAGCTMYYVRRRLSRHTRVQNIDRKAVPYRGVVWCPRTPNGTFFARRNGTTYFTGNTMARGWYPVSGVDTVIIQPALLSDARGEFQFAEDPTPVGALDVALEGEDTAFLAVGRSGRAYGYRKAPVPGGPPDGELVHFVDSAGKRHHRQVLQVDQLISLPKADTVRMAQNLRDICKNAGIRPDCLAVDRTGNGAGVHDLMRATYGQQVHGFNPSTSSTDQRILAEDTELPSESYVRLATEFWFALRKWLEVGAIKFSPTISTEPLWGELTGRRFQQGEAGKAKVESKADYKSRGNKSPDRADSVTNLLHLVRMRERVTPSHDLNVSDADFRPQKPRVGHTDEFQYLD